MPQLADYIAVILNQATTSKIVDCSVEEDSWQEEDAQITHRTCRYQFSDGALIESEVEHDSIDNPELVCPELWLEYRVIQHPESGTITPAQKSFDNACRQSFWLKMQQAGRA